MKHIKENLLLLVLVFNFSFIVAQQTVEVYTMPGCGRCAYSVKYLKENNIKYVEYSTENDSYNSKMWELLQNSKDFKGGSITMPVIVKQGAVYFNIDKLEDFMSKIGGGSQNQNQNQNKNQNQQNKVKTGCISGDCDNGFGIYVWENKDKYEGQFSNSSLSGKGKYTWASGEVYNGEWKDGVQNGFGEYSDENGNIQSGNWVSGVLQEGSEEVSNENENENISNNSQKLSNQQIKEFIDTHNSYRAEVNTGTLSWSNELADYAQAWGEHLAKIGCEMEHRPRSGEWEQKYGENLFWCSGYTPTPASAVNSWGEEKPDYDGGVMNNKNFVAGHYTQMIWAQTTKVGCAIVSCSEGSYIIVCNYSPAGNYWGQSPLKK